jgi:phytoene dehydrogenase-like protein
MTKNVDAVVVGGGPAGLAAAARLARSGASVLVLERSSALGGRAASYSEEGITLNQGAHALYLGGPAARTLRELGVAWSGTPPRSPWFFCESGNERFTMPTTTMGLLKTNLLSFGDKIALGRALSGLSIDARLWSTPASEWIASVVDSERARAFLSALMRVSTYTADLELLSAGAAVKQLSAVRRSGVTYVDGGWQTIVDGLARAAERAGAAIETNAAPSRVVREGERWRVEIAGRDAVVANTAILAVGPRAAHALCPESRALANAAEDAIPAHAACLDVALRSLPNPHHHFTLGLDRADHLSLHSAFAKLAPEGTAVFHLARYLRQDEGVGEDAARVRGELEGLFSRAQPGWESHAFYTRFLPRMIVSNAIPLAKNAGKRADVVVADAPSLFVCGDWAADEGMLLDAALGSAERAAALARERTKMRSVA